MKSAASEALVEEFLERQRLLANRRETLVRESGKAASTPDGRKLLVTVNIESSEAGTDFAIADDAGR